MDWINAGMLTGLLALGIPILIHLLRSRRFQPASLGTLRFLCQAIRENKRWRRFQNLLLLFVRLMIVALLTFLFARPFFKEPEQSYSKDIEAILLIDVSEADYVKALDWARKRLSLSKSQHKRVFLFTDMQKISLPETPLEDWPLDISVKIVPVALPGMWNATIKSVRNLSPYLGGDSEMEISIACFGDIPSRELDMAVEVEGQKALVRKVPLRSGSIVLKWSPKRIGLYRGVVHIKSNDSYPLDDRRHFVLSVREPIPVLLVNGEPGVSVFENETYFVEMALKVSGREDGQSAFSPSRQETIVDPRRYRVVALCNVAELDNSEIDQFIAYVKKGGNLVYFLGGRIQLDSYQKLCDRGLFPGELKWCEVAIPRQITQWDSSHSALQVFDSKEIGDLSRIIFRQVFEIVPSNNTHVLAGLSNDSPAIVEKRLGQGCIIAVANPCDRDWSDWPTERIFLPLIRELFAYMSSVGHEKPRIAEKVRGLQESRTPGIYEDESLTVVVTDPLESDIRSLPETEFRKMLGVGQEARKQELAISDMMKRPARSERRNEIWFYLSIGLLAFIPLEQFLADRRRL
jgi:hypothetical protein